MKRFMPIVLALALVFLPNAAHAFSSGPSFDDYRLANIEEKLANPKASSNSDIKALMGIKLIVSGGDQPSGLTTTSLNDWDIPDIDYRGFSDDSSTFTIGSKKWITWWDVKSRKLKRVVYVDNRDHFIFGADQSGKTLIIGKAKRKDNKSVFQFKVYDGDTLKKIRELKYNKQSQKEIFGDFNKNLEYALSPAGNWFILAHALGPLQVWEVASGALAYERYNYNNPKNNTFINFARNDRSVYISNGGKHILYSLNPFKKLRELGKTPYPLVISPKGTYLAHDTLRLIKADGGELCSHEMLLPGTGFTYDEKFWLKLYKNGIAYHPTEAKDCPKIDTAFLSSDKEREKRVGEVLPAPDGQHYALTYYTVPETGRTLTPAVRIERWFPPSAEKADVLVKVERGIKLYKGGLKKQGEAMLSKLIDEHPKILWLADYDTKFAQSGIPLSLVGKMIVAIIKDEVDMAAGRGLTMMQYYYGKYALFACQAQQPFLAAIALEKVNAQVREGHVKLGEDNHVRLTAVNALSLKLAGRDDDAYSALIESGLGKSMLKVFQIYPDAFAPLLREPDKLALALDIDAKRLPKPGSLSIKQDYVDLDGTLVPASPSTSTKPAARPLNKDKTQPTRKPPKKKSSVILD